MISKIFVCCLLATLSWADNSVDSNVMPEESMMSFETSHKRPEALGDDGFQTSHRISHYDVENMNLLPTKEKPELNPVLSALINEDVMKSIEAKRAIEKAELEIVKSELEAEEKKKQVADEEEEEEAAEEEEEPLADMEKTTEVPLTVLTTAAPTKKADLDKDDEINMGFVDQAIALETAGTENNKKSRIEIKKGPNGQDYEYEYVYYYDVDDDDVKAKPGAADAKEKDKEEEAESRGKSRYTNIERSTAATPVDNSLVSGKAKGRSSNVEENVETERLPHNTRFPSRGKNVDVPPTPALDSVDSAAEKKKISVKRPSLELVDSETFNTDEKQAKGSRNAENDAKSAITIEQEMAAAQAAATAAKEAEEADALKNAVGDTAAAEDEDIEQTTPAMEKAALDLYAILANENNNMEMTTDSDMDATTLLPDTTDMYGDDMLTTILSEEPSSTTTTTTTTTPEPTTTTTTTTTTPAPLFGGKRGGANAAGRNRFKLKSGGATTSTTTEASAAAETPKSNKNRFQRPSIGSRPRLGAKTTPATAHEDNQEEEVSAKEVKPVSTGFGRNKPRNRFNLRGSTTTETPAVKSDDGAEETVSSTTSRTLRGRPTLNLRGRSRTTTSKTPPAEEETANDSDNSVDEKPATPAPAKPSRFNLNRAAGGRLPPRGKLGRTTAAPASADDSAADSSHHNDVKGEGEESSDKPADETPSANAGGLNRLKSRPRLGGAHKTESTKPKALPAPAPPRKVNPLLAKKRLQLGSSTTEAAPVEESSPSSSEESEANEEAAAATNEEHKEEAPEEAETTTKQQARGLGLLGQRRRLPLRKPGTLL